MRRPALATLTLALLALFFGWETRQALRATTGGKDNAAMAPVNAWQPGVSAPDPEPGPDPRVPASAVAARPLFRPDRQPFREQVAGGSGRNYEAELSRYTLLGVLGFGDAPYGVVVGKGGNKEERWEVKRGDSLQGFAVKEVEMDGLRLTADGKEFLLPLYAGPPTAVGSAVRTGTNRRDAAQPVAAPASTSGTAAPAPRSAPGVSRIPPSASWPPFPTRSRRPITAWPPATENSPAVAPRNIPGRQ